ncbi:MAG TPA: hypothetical protein VGM03_04430 [Phycisphaerae bacterium]
MTRVLISGLALLGLGVPLAYAGSHTWKVNELFTNASGTVQFVELHESNGTPGEYFLAGHFVSSTATGHSFTFPSNLVPPTSNKYLLLATPAFAALPGAPTPDYLFAAGSVPFFSTSADTVHYYFYDAMTFTSIPTDGIHSLNFGGVIAVNSPTNYAGQTGTVDASGATMATIASANPPSDNPYLPGQPFRDVLDTGTDSSLTAGIGGAGTAPQGSIQYAQISVTFSVAPNPAPSTSNISIACTGGACPSVTAVSGSGTGPYTISLSGVIPPAQCTTLTFAGTSAGQNLQYQSLPGDVNLDGSSSTVDLLWLVQRLNDGTANLPGNYARYNLNRSGESPPVNTADLLRLVQLLNGVNTTQVFNGASVAACP